MAEVILEATLREKGKKSSLTDLRSDGYVPGVFYKHGEENKLFYVKEIKLKPLIFSGETYLIDLKIDNNEVQKCVIKQFQLDPVTSKIVHVDMLGLKEGEKITVDVAVKLFGNSVGVKDGGVLQFSLHKLQVECLPSEIPNKIDVDISSLKIGDSIHVKDIKVEGLRILNNPDATIVAVMHPTVEKAVTPVETEGEAEVKEPEVISKGKKTEEEE